MNGSRRQVCQQGSCDGIICMSWGYESYRTRVSYSLMHWPIGLTERDVWWFVIGCPFVVGTVVCRHRNDWKLRFVTTILKNTDTFYSTRGNLKISTIRTVDAPCWMQITHHKKGGECCILLILSLVENRKIGLVFLMQLIS